MDSIIDNLWNEYTTGNCQILISIPTMNGDKSLFFKKLNTIIMNEELDTAKVLLVSIPRFHSQSVQEYFKINLIAYIITYIMIYDMKNNKIIRELKYTSIDFSYLTIKFDSNEENILLDKTTFYNRLFLVKEIMDIITKCTKYIPDKTLYYRSHLLTELNSFVIPYKIIMDKLRGNVCNSTIKTFFHIDLHNEVIDIVNRHIATKNIKSRIIFLINKLNDTSVSVTDLYSNAPTTYNAEFYKGTVILIHSNGIVTITLKNLLLTQEDYLLKQSRDNSTLIFYTIDNKSILLSCICNSDMILCYPVGSLNVVIDIYKENNTKDIKNIIHEFITTDICVDDMCTICQCDYKVTDIVVKFKCSHSYHHKCITNWFASIANYYCPICKVDISKV